MKRFLFMTLVCAMAWISSSAGAQINHCNKMVGTDHVDLIGIHDEPACRTLAGSWRTFRPHCHKQGDHLTDLPAKTQEACLAAGGQWYDPNAVSRN
jgi:hypothetical protein